MRRVKQLFDFYADAGDGTSRAVKRRPNHRMDFLAVSHHYDTQVYKPSIARMQENRPGAVGVDVYLPVTGVQSLKGLPLSRIESNLRQVPFAVEVSHVHAPHRDADSGGWEDQSFNSGSVIALQTSVGAGSVVELGAGKRAGQY